MTKPKPFVIVVYTDIGMLVGEGLHPSVLALSHNKDNPIKLTHPCYLRPVDNKGTLSIQPVPLPKDEPYVVIKDWKIVHLAEDYLAQEYEKAKASFLGIKIATGEEATKVLSLNKK